MKGEQSHQESENQRFHDISAVSRLTGLTTANLRVWESRYGVASPVRSESGRRQYHEDDVHRLSLLKRLADLGHPIRTTSNLPVEELEKRLAQAEGQRKSHAFEPAESGSGLVRVVVVGQTLPETLGALDTVLTNGEVVDAFHEFSEAETSEALQADLLVVELPSLFESEAGRILRLMGRFGATRTVVVYSFSQSKTIQKFDAGFERVSLMRAPFTSEHLDEICAEEVRLERASRRITDEKNRADSQNNDVMAERRYSDRQLARISQISSAIECECPNHLASLLTNLTGFEQYSADCENRNAADAEIHAYLHRMTSRARAIVEDALEVLVEFENIEVGED